MDTYTIKEATKRVNCEAHVLRYWEEELGLVIKRNGMGHRYYDDRDILLFEKIKELKELGMSLKQIRAEIDKRLSSKANAGNNETTENKESIQVTSTIKESADTSLKVVDFKQAQLQNVMNKVVANAFRENKDIITASIKEEVTADVMRQFDTVMREKEEREENRFKRIDEYLRQIQQANEEIAATKSKGFFRRKNKTR